MIRAAVTWVALLSLGLGGVCAAHAQARKPSTDRWEPISMSMSDLLQDGYRLVSVVAPSPQLRIFFLSKEGMVAKCSEEPNQPPPPIAGSKGRPNFDPGEYARGVESRIECSRLSK
jgi:hypothetical protein